VLEAVGADPTAAFRAATMGAEGLWNPVYGTRGGSPYGGVCLPKDTLAFLGYAEEQGLGDMATILRAAVAVNDRLVELAATEAQAKEAANDRAHEAVS
jgi:UDPglucose 6-dehydrogenase